jgi:serine/threonine protein phosphatase PrpC
MKYTWATRTDVGRVRQQNEDLMPPRPEETAAGNTVAAIADGMGGAGGEIASATAIATVAVS